MLSGHEGMVDQLADISLVARTLLALVFGAAALGKARHLSGFTNTLLDLGFPAKAARLAAPILIGYEAVLVVLFAAGFYSFIAAVLAVGLLLAFVTVSLVAHVSKRTVLCNCFGVSDATLGPSTIARSGLLMLPAVAYVWLPPFDKATMMRPFETSVVLAALTVGLLLLGKWILASPRLVRLTESRRSSESSLAGYSQLEQRSSAG